RSLDPSHDRHVHREAGEGGAGKEQEHRKSEKQGPFHVDLRVPRFKALSLQVPGSERTPRGAPRRGPSLEEAGEGGQRGQGEGGGCGGGGDSPPQGGGLPRTRKLVRPRFPSPVTSPSCSRPGEAATTPLSRD